MFSRIIFFAVNVIFAANGFVYPKSRLLNPMLKCYEVNAHEFSGEKATAARLNLKSDAEDLKLSCLTAEESVKCLADVLEKTPSPVPKVYLFYSATSYQTSYLLKKAHLCPGIKYDDLKKIVLNSGILKKEGLTNIENDRYHKCAGDAIKKCLIESMQVFELEQGEPDADDNADDKYILCMEEQKTKACNHPIMRHFLEQIEAYKKHVKQLEMLESEKQQA